MKYAFFTLIFLGLFFQLNAATITWDGGAGTTNWEDVMNWDTDVLPTSADDVIIDGDVVDISASTQVQRIYAGGSAVLTINAGVTVTLDGFTGDDAGLEIQGSATLVNNGIVTITNVSGGGDAVGMYSKGTSTNNGTISIDGTDRHGLYVVAGLFTNASTGMITVTNVGNFNTDADNIYIDDANSGTLFGAFSNEGTITILVTTGDHGLFVNDNSTFDNASTLNITYIGPEGDEALATENGGEFNNNNGGIVTISTSQDHGIGLKSNSTINNNMGGTINIDAVNDDQIVLESSSAFNNGGIINLTNAVDVAIHVKDGDFINSSTGELNIADATDHGLYVQGADAHLENSGTITVTNGASSSDGVRLNNGGTLTNNAGANMNFITIGDEGIAVDLACTFTNIGTITITSPSSHGMEIYGTFDNMAGAIVNVNTSNETGVNMQDDALFNNAATAQLNVTDSGIEGIRIDANGSTATLDNSGIITVMGGAADGIRVQESGVLTNNTGGMITVSNADDICVELDVTGIVNNSGTFTITGSNNHGIDLQGTCNNQTGGVLVINTSGNNGINLTNAGVLTNAATGMVNISASDNHNMLIDPNSSTGTCTNDGTITLTGGTAADGLRMQESAEFNNNATGILNIVSSFDDSMEIDADCVFNNLGTVDILNSGDHGLDLQGTFNNMMGSLYKATDCADDGIRNAGGTFNNDGNIRIDGSGSEDIETDNNAFVNSATATFAPGSSPGDLEVRDDVDFGASTITFEITGTTEVTEYDQIRSVNPSTAPFTTLTLSGATAHLDWGSFVPVVGDCFNLVTGSGHITGGEFGTFTTTNTNIVYEVTTPDDNPDDGLALPTKVTICVTELLTVPVELVRFTGKKLDRGTQLHWETASEINNEGFDVERSNNSHDWRKITSVQGKGNSTSSEEYEYFDDSPSTGMNYYRLKQNDFDGNFEYSNTISVSFTNEQNEVTYYPNPVEDVLFIDMDQDLENVQIELYDSNGRVIWQSNKMVRQIPFESYSPGIYFLKIGSKANSTIQRITKI